MSTLILDGDGEEFLTGTLPKGCRIFKNSKNGYWYIDYGSARKLVAIHRYLVCAKPGEMVDHIDGNKNNNAHANLRRCSKKTNAINSKKRKNTFSKYRGVTRNTNSKTFSARACKVYLGSFPSEVDAAQAYDSYMEKYYPEFARLNFPRED